MSAREAYSAARDSATSWSTDAYLVHVVAGCNYYIASPNICIRSDLEEVGRGDGTSARWGFVFHSPSNHLEATFQVTRAGVEMTSTDEESPFDVAALPIDSAMDSTEAVSVAERFLKNPSAVASVPRPPGLTIEGKRLIGLRFHRETSPKRVPSATGPLPEKHDLWIVDYGPDSGEGGTGIHLEIDAHTAEIVELFQPEWSSW
jgi:hypothetical protein